MRRALFALLFLFVFRALFGQSTEQLAKSDSLFARGVALYHLAKFNEAIPCFEESDRIDKAELAPESYRRDYSAMWLASCYYNIGDSITAAKIDSKFYKTAPIDRRLTVQVDSLLSLAKNYEKKANYEKALQLSNLAGQIVERIFGPKHLLYANIITYIGGLYYDLGEYNNARKYMTNAFHIYESILSNKHLAYGSSLSNLALVNYVSARFSEAINQGKESLSILENFIDTEPSFYVSSLCNLALFYSAINNFPEAIKYGEKALSYYENLEEENFYLQATILSIIGSSYAELGNYEEAIRIGLKALRVCEQNVGKDHPMYATLLSNLANYNSSLGNYNKAINLEVEAFQVRAKIFGKEHPDYALSLNNIAIYYFYLGNYEEAIRFLSETLQIQEKILGKDHPNYANTLSNLSNNNSRLGNYNEAIKLGEEALLIREKILGKEHPDYAISLGNLCSFYREVRDFEKVDELSGELFNLLSKQVKSTFRDLTTAERVLFWETKKEVFEGGFNQLAYFVNTDNVVKSALNATLLSKGVLLSTDIAFATLINESGDAETIKKYEELLRSNHILNKALEKPLTERFVDTDSLSRVINALERELVANSKAFGDFTHNMTVTWEDVRDKLGENDVAIEFVTFPGSKTGTIYAAYVITPFCGTPEMVPLFESSALTEIPAESYYVDRDLANLVWGNLKNYLDGKANVYFAPAGELYNIAIESLPHFSDEGLISDRHNLFRLSSTRQLALVKDATHYTKSALYGGMQYDTDPVFLKEDMERFPELRHRDYSFMNSVDSLGMRAGVSELPGTAVEIDNIQHALERTSIEPMVYKGLDGTEASFKSLSGKKTSLMHFATHGFYFTESEVRRSNSLSFLALEGDGSRKHTEDKALTRSGLLFSGANNALRGNPIPPEVEDGILTAKEISQLDLRGLDLVVMSACQTGLGEITGDGVFGLQRGFKKAGANSLLMSLWKVDDKATQMLMTKFYEFFLAGKTKFEALKLAQLYLKNYEENPNESLVQNSDTRQANENFVNNASSQPSDDTNFATARTKIKPFEHPKYWAAFILLDAID